MGDLLDGERVDREFHVGCVLSGSGKTGATYRARQEREKCADSTAPGWRLRLSGETMSVLVSKHWVRD